MYGQRISGTAEISFVIILNHFPFVKEKIQIFWE